MDFEISEEALTDELINELIALSADWETENITYGYIKNEPEEFTGKRVFTARLDGRPVGYLFGAVEKSKRVSSLIDDGVNVFELDELYVKPALRAQGIGKALFSYAEAALRPEAEFILLSAVSKNWRALLRFYIDELGMDMWSARLFKRLDRT